MWFSLPRNPNPKPLNPMFKQLKDLVRFQFDAMRQSGKLLATDNKLRLDILTTIIGIKQDENKVAHAETAKRRQKEFLKDLLGRKKIGEMEAMTVEQIEAQLATLG